MCDKPARVPGCQDFYNKAKGRAGLGRNRKQKYFVEFVKRLRKMGILKEGLVDVLADMVAEEEGLLVD